jgi:hypothetical protein
VAGAAPRTLAMIRMAMTSGIIAFATAVFYMRQSANAPDPMGDAGFLRRLALGAAVLSVIGIGILRQRLADAPVERRNAMCVVGWAIGEFGAIAGIAAYFVSGVEAAAAPGMLAYVIALLVFPIRRA